MGQAAINRLARFGQLYTNVAASSVAGAVIIAEAPAAVAIATYSALTDPEGTVEFASSVAGGLMDNSPLSNPPSTSLKNAGGSIVGSIIGSQCLQE